MTPTSYEWSDGEVATTATRTLSGLKANTTYTYSVRGVDANGNKSPYGSITFKTEASAS